MSELSSDDELNDELSDEWSLPDDDKSSNEQSDCDDVIDESTSSDDEPLASIIAKKKKYKFDRRRGFIPPTSLDFTDAALEPEPKEDTPYNYFKYFVTSDMLEYLAEESNNYAHQKAGFTLQTSSSELETFMGLYFQMGLVKMPAVGCFWETYTRYRPIADVMGRQRFQKITSYLHIANNLKVTEEDKKDRAWKIRRWIDDLNSNFAKVIPSENQCVDEIMVAFKGRSILKQYLPKKPKKWGFKLWARCSSSGFLHVSDIYQGKGTGIDDEDSISECGLEIMFSSSIRQKLQGQFVKNCDLKGLFCF